MERLWENAVNIAMDHVVDRSVDVVNTVAARLKAISRHEEAAVMYMGVESFREAIDSYLQGKLYEKARHVATTDAPQFLSYVEQQYQGHLQDNGQTEQLGERNAGAAIEMYVAKGQWDKVYDLAEKQGDGQVNKFATIHAKSLVGEKKFKEALAVFTRWGVPAIPNNFNLYKRIAQEILASSSENQLDTRDTAEDKAPEGHKELREMLYKLVNEMTDVMPVRVRERGVES